LNSQNTSEGTTGGKRAAGEAAYGEVRSGMSLGLGTGSTVQYFLEALARGLRSGEVEDVRGVPTSRHTEARCEELGIPLLDLHEAGELDIAVDGADEVDPELELIKGMGGALLREKMVASAARRFVVIVDESKVVRRLGSLSPLPVEVVRFGWRTHLSFFADLGADPVPRESADGELYVTDNGNYVVDLTFPGAIDDPPELDDLLKARAGVVESGLFLNMAHRVHVGGDDGVRTLDRRGWPL
jgi:ribose 5-phosphate isomerase A